VKNILITGGAGFIASYLVRHLVLKYPSYRIISFDKLDYCATLNNTRSLDDQPNFQFVYGDVTDIKTVIRCIKDHAIDTIFHFAAQSHVDLSFGNSFEFTKTNVEGTHIMLESAVRLSVKRFIHISTDEVNGEHDGPDLTEASLLKPTNPYAASKAAAEMYVNAYSMSFKLASIIVRSNNVYGPHQYPEKIIPKFASLLERRKKLIIHGDGLNTRRYLYAGDAADAFDTILHQGGVGEIYNVGSRDEVSNVKLAEMMLGLFGREGDEEAIQYVKDRPFNDKRYAVDATKLRGLGWEQKTGFEDGLKLTVEWYRRFGKTWWGDVESVLTAFPEVREVDGWAEEDPRKPLATPSFEIQNRMPAKEGALLVVPEGGGMLAIRRRGGESVWKERRMRMLRMGGSELCWWRG
jgi:dTDP-glucose 4,6-dehydratase